MAKTAIKCKESMVKEIINDLNRASSLIVTNYRGLKAQELNELRKELRAVSGHYVIVKNSMAKRALANSPNKRIADLLNAEVGVAIDSKNDPSSISKILVNFAKKHEVLKICGGAMEGSELTNDDIIHLASLPSREVLLGKLANVLNAPIQGLACSLKSIISKLVYVLDAVKDKLPAEAPIKEEAPKEETKAETKGAPEAAEAEKPIVESEKSENKEEVGPEEKKDETKPEN